ncbi:hypothetical protein P376_5474 [Streptomyces sp. HCCB10043]|nr:hypothetical protein P376_5474 [Streptomyces sp. HCCB10043]
MRRWSPAERKDLPRAQPRLPLPRPGRSPPGGVHRHRCAGSGRVRRRACPRRPEHPARQAAGRAARAQVRVRARFTAGRVRVRGPVHPGVRDPRGRGHRGRDADRRHVCLGG